MAQSVFTALLAGRPEARSLLPGRFEDPEEWTRAADRAAASRVPGPVMEEMVRQSRALPLSEARTRMLEKLTHPGATVVVTGQQVGLFGGPLYTLHKAATAIARARWIEERVRRPCVPVFWLQTEDHDYPEIANVTVQARTEPMTLALPPDPHPSRVSIAHRTVPEQVDAVLAEAEAALSPLPHAAEVLALLRAHYVPGRPMASAFAGLMAELWQAEGLVVLDPRVPAVARSAAPLFQRVLREHAALASVLGARAAEIERIGCDVQVPSRPEASLVFFHPARADGPRYRLVRRDDGFETPEGPVSIPTLENVLEREPLRFSSSALLRPLVQDSILPTCAYVGGPAEVSYFAELPPLYEHLGLPLPLVAPRARLRLLDAPTRSLLERLGLAAADVETSRDALLARVAIRPDGAGTLAELEARLLGPLRRELDALAALGVHNLEGPIQKTRDACTEAVGRLASKVERALLERDQATLGRVERVQAALYPAGVPQERAYGFLTLAARSGTAALTRVILAGAESFDPRVGDIPL